MEEMEHAQTKLSRVARWAENENMECCEKDARQVSENETAIVTRCILETKSQASEMTVKQVICLVDCLAKKYDVVDADGYLDTEKAALLIKAKDHWGQLFANKDDVIKRCVTFANSFSKERGTVVFEEKKCNMAPAVITNCIRAMVEINCPEDRKVPGAQCDKLRRKLSQVVDALNI
ncbi:general odorant-binding protein 68-like isoform X2 [Cryptotermes secundus]|uniref:general odorant-binding protein 68-like isoform X2 n=1 Tax=Cryptotermes secundus TaxID=105785 RepID=UPI000CD7CD54|nr:general odorant-binding protein 68-like isoform X2 [Cryptotermes secundus]